MLTFLYIPMAVPLIPIVPNIPTVPICCSPPIMSLHLRSQGNGSIFRETLATSLQVGYGGAFRTFVLYNSYVQHSVPCLGMALYAASPALLAAVFRDIAPGAVCPIGLSARLVSVNAAGSWWYSIAQEVLTSRKTRPGRSVLFVLIGDAPLSSGACRTKQVLGRLWQLYLALHNTCGLASRFSGACCG